MEAEGEGEAAGWEAVSHEREVTGSHHRVSQAAQRPRHDQASEGVGEAAAERCEARGAATGNSPGVFFCSKKLFKLHGPTIPTQPSVRHRSQRITPKERI